MASSIEMVKSRLSKALAAEPCDTASLIELGALELGIEGDEKSAIALFERAVECDATSADAKVWLANAMYIRRGEWKPIEELLKQALAIDPDHVNGLYILAMIMYKRKREWPEQLAVLDRALKHGGRNAAIRKQRAEVLLGLGRNDEAVREIERARRLLGEGVDWYAAARFEWYRAWPGAQRDQQVLGEILDDLMTVVSARRGEGKSGKRPLVDS